MMPRPDMLRKGLKQFRINHKENDNLIDNRSSSSAIRHSSICTFHGVHHRYPPVVVNQAISHNRKILTLGNLKCVPILRAQE